MHAPALKPPHLATLVALTALSTVSLNMFLPALAQIAVDLGTSYARISLAVSGYLALTGVLLLGLGPLSDRVGRRPVMLGSLGIFTIASVGCALAWDAASFLALRTLQGAMIAGHVITLAVIRDTRAEGEAASVLGYIAMAMALGPMLAPVLGGVLDTYLGWRAIFWVYASLGAGALLLCSADLRETRRAGPGGQPASRALLTHPRFWALALCIGFSTGGFYIFLTGAPLVAREVFGISTAQLGLFVGSITGGYMLGSFLAGRFVQRIGGSAMILTGRVSACAGPVLGLAAAGAGVLTPLTCFGATILVGLGNGLTMPPANAQAMSVVPERIGAAAGLSGAVTLGLGALLTTLAGRVVLGEDAAERLLVLLLAASVLALVAALVARRV